MQEIEQANKEQRVRLSNPPAPPHTTRLRTKRKNWNVKDHGAKTVWKWTDLWLYWGTGGWEEEEDEEEEVGPETTAE